MVRPSITYLPEDLQGEVLFETATELIDLARASDSMPQITVDIDPVVNNLLASYTDLEAVQVYHNMFVKPSYGSVSALLYVLNLLGLDAELKEWFVANFYMPAYHFSLDFDEFPPNLDIDLLIDLINALKNERSRLLVIRQPPEFREMLVLDRTHIDYGILDNIGGYRYRGVNIFLANRRKQHIDDRQENPITIYSAQSSVYGQELNEEFDYATWRLDHYRLDNTGRIFPSMATLRTIVQVSESVQVPRRGVGQPTGEIHTYKSSVSSAHRSENV